MEKLNHTKNKTGNKKVFFRKEIDASRLGEERYSEAVLSHYSVYLLRKFEVTSDYEEVEQFEALLAKLPEQFNNEFEECVVKNLYLRVTQKTVYVTLLLAFAHPLSKPQIRDLRKWISSLKVPELSLEHLSTFSEDLPIEIVKGLQETNSEVLLLTEMMNQFSEKLKDIYKEVQPLKDRRTPPVVKVVQSKIAAKEASEAENAKQLKIANRKIEQLVEEFSTVKAHIENKLSNLPESKKPPKFKIVAGSSEESRATVENRLEEALQKINLLTQRITHSDQRVSELTKSLEKNKQEQRPKLNFSIAKKVNKEQNKLVDKLATTNEEVTSIARQLLQIDNKLSTVETTILAVKPESETIARIEKDHGQLQETASATVKLKQAIDQLTTKFKAVEAKLAKSDSVKKLTEQHRKDQEQLKSMTTDIKKLTQTVRKVDVQLINAHQKIAELEQKVRQTVSVVTVQGSNNSTIESSVPVLQINSVIQEANRSVKVAIEEEEEGPIVPLPIEEMLDRVSEKYPQTAMKSTLLLDEEQHKTNTQELQEAFLQDLKKLEWNVHSSFQQGQGLGHRGIMEKNEFYANIRKIEVLPYLWASIYEREEKDILVGNDLSCQQLMNNLTDFLNELGILSRKRKVMGKWIYCSKEVEQKMEGYKLLSEYLEMYLARQNGVHQ